ncbi:stressosome-associated protein Prli42 [Heyndrickxia acidiproducens]|nr:stressosome-associated protein Prli42 [Heyndrickxia acidiproducens]
MSKRTQKIVVYLMLFAMLATTILSGLSMLF